MTARNGPFSDAETDDVASAASSWEHRVDEAAARVASLSAELNERLAR